MFYFILFFRQVNAILTFYRTLRCCQLLLLPCSCYQHMCIPRVRRCISLFMWSEGRVSRVNMIHHVKYMYWYLFLKVCVFSKETIHSDGIWMTIKPGFYQKKNLNYSLVNLILTAQRSQLCRRLIFSFPWFTVLRILSCTI